MDRRKAPRYFDNNKPLVSCKNQLVNGEQLSPGGLISSDLPHSVRLRIWMSGLACYQKDYKATPVADADQSGEHLPDVAAIEPQPGGYYLISASWLAEPLRVRGKETAAEVHAQIMTEREAALADEAQGDDAGDDAGGDDQQGEPEQPSDEADQSGGDDAGDDSGNANDA
jgi:hypothetical protein